ncbi:hypothetical protein KM043_014690 [Ampulex compressa]|nr:hypothetical protein KM043_014690 [Ampulex compressa]
MPMKVKNKFCQKQPEMVIWRIKGGRVEAHRAEERTSEPCMNQGFHNERKKRRSNQITPTNTVQRGWSGERDDRREERSKGAEKKPREEEWEKERGSKMEKGRRLGGEGGGWGGEKERKGARGERKRAGGAWKERRVSLVRRVAAWMGGWVDGCAGVDPAEASLH